MNRRQYVATVAGLTSVALAGCQDDTEEIIEREQENMSEDDEDDLDDVEVADDNESDDEDG